MIEAMGQIHTATLQPEQVVGRRRIPRRLLNGIEARHAIDEATGDLVIEMSRLIYYHNGDTLRVPRTWWDHLKLTLKEHRRCPSWLREHLWVNYEIHQARMYLPELLYDNPPFHVQVHTWKTITPTTRSDA